MSRKTIVIGSFLAAIRNHSSSSSSSGPPHQQQTQTTSPPSPLQGPSTPHLQKNQKIKLSHPQESSHYGQPTQTTIQGHHQWSPKEHGRSRRRREITLSQSVKDLQGASRWRYDQIHLVDDFNHSVQKMVEDEDEDIIQVQAQLERDFEGSFEGKIP